MSNDHREIPGSGRNPHRLLLILILWSAFVLLVVVVVDYGLENTSYETTDSQGRAMGFNDWLNFEHYTIAIRNFRLSSLFRWSAAYEWLLITMQAVGFYLLANRERTSRRSTRWFFICQPLIFWIGVIGFPIAVGLWHQLFRSQFDRETFVDLPFVWIITHSSWALTSLLIAAAMRVEPRARPNASG